MGGEEINQINAEPILEDFAYENPDIKFEGIFNINIISK